MFFQTENNSKPLIFAHRGLVTHYQENTKTAVLAAMNTEYCHGAEFDVFLTKDSKVVLFHDDTLERVTGVKGKIIEKTWKELQTLVIKKDIIVDGGMRHYEREEKISLLEDVLQAIKDSGRTDFYLDIEMKPAMPKYSQRALGKEVAKIVRKLEMESQCLSTSFDFFKLYAMEKEHRKLTTGFAYDDDTFTAKSGKKRFIRLLNRLMEWNFVGRFIHSDVVNIEHTLIDNDSIKKYHRRKMAVGTYTLFPLLPPDVNYPEHEKYQYYVNETKRLAAMGVNWIETDNPEIVYQIIYGTEETPKKKGKYGIS